MTEAPRRRINWAFEAAQIALCVLALVGIHSAVAKPFYIPSGSMLPTLLVGDQLAVSKYPYGYSYLSPSVNILPPVPGRLLGRLPERGDVVVIKSPYKHEDWIKRVIGLPGDSVQMRDGQLWLNGAPVPRVAVASTIVPISANSDCTTPIDAPYRDVDADGGVVCRFPTFRETLPSGRSYLTMDLARTPQDNTDPVIVPEGAIFLMGDNRDNSEDSRFDPLLGGLGMLPIENLVGRAEVITYSVDGSATLDPSTWLGAVRPGRFLVGLRAPRD